MRLIDENQFDTIYHEHFSYFSFSTVERVFARARPAARSTSRSCRRTAARCGSTAATPTMRRVRRRERVAELLEREEARGLLDGSTTYRALRASRSSRTKRRPARRS